VGNRSPVTPKEAKVFVNNRRLIDSELSVFGFSQEEKLSATRLIDRSDKMKIRAWEAFGLESGLTTKQLSNVKSILADQELWKKSDELIRCFTAVNALGLDDYIQFDPTVIRGLDYYTGTVYEGKACASDIHRSIAGGGRYDNLLADVGGEPLPGTGFAMGDMVIMLLLEKYGLLPEDLDASPAPVMVTIFDEDHLLDSFKLAMELRQAGLRVATYPTTDKLGKQFKYADRIGAKIAVVLGPDEIKAGQVAVKNLKNRSQENIARGKAVEHISRMLA